MLPRAHRLTTADLRQFTGRRLVTPTLHLLVRPSATPQSRMAVLIPKKAMSKAHQRNRLKRVLAHQMRPYLDRSPSHDHLLIVKPPAASSSETAVVADLNRLLAQVSKEVNSG